MNKNLKQIAVPLVSVLLGLVLGAIIMWAFSYDALWGYELLFKKAFGSIKSWGNISRAMGPLILVALGFSVAVKASTNIKCWCTIPIPKEAAFEGESRLTVFPFTKMSPLVGSNKPASIFIRVDFPAPFSPRSAWISPLRN